MSYHYLYGYIYLTTNKVNGKKYVGQKQGKFNPNYLGSGVYLKDAINHYGKENFQVEVLAWAKNREELNSLERDEISKRDAVIDETYYNLALGGDAWGSPQTEKTRRKIAEAAIGRVPGNKGKKFPEISKRMRENNPMKRPEVVAKVAAAQKGKRPWNYGLSTGPNGTKITETITTICPTCGKGTERRNVVKQRHKKFCNRSCQATYTNARRWRKA